MLTPLIQKNPKRYAGPEAMVYAYEADPVMMGYQLAQGLTKAANYLLRDYNADGAFRLAAMRGERSEVTVNYFPPSPVRVEVKPDSIITSYTTNTPEGGRVQVRIAAATK